MTIRRLQYLLVVAIYAGMLNVHWLEAQVKNSRSAEKPIGQKQEIADDSKACIQLLKDFARAYSEITLHRDKSKVLAFFTPNLATEITNLTIKGEVQNRYSDYRQFAQYLERLSNIPSLQIKYTIEQILHTLVKNNFGVVVYEVAYEILRDGETLIKGKEVNTANMVKSNNRWLISYYTIYDIATEQQRGSCQCEIFKGEGNKYLTQTNYPSGTQYETATDNFMVGEYDATIGGRLITVRNLRFVWKKNGSIVQLVAQKGQWQEDSKELGITDEEQEALLIILRTVLFTDNCLSVRKR
ncbi:MAG: hypothetical protein RMJ87_14100 [Cytophagales bacterium]|nr:hypothetical protein [Bernardetiaceae bacterium]MDW8206156.1 hypothetical protein [Cytophagales bacterium]